MCAFWRQSLQLAELRNAFTKEASFQSPEKTPLPTAKLRFVVSQTSPLRPLRCPLQFFCDTPVRTLTVSQRTRDHKYLDSRLSRSGQYSHVKLLVSRPRLNRHREGAPLITERAGLGIGGRRFFKESAPVESKSPSGSDAFGQMDFDRPGALRSINSARLKSSLLRR